MGKKLNHIKAIESIIDIADKLEEKKSLIKLIFSDPDGVGRVDKMLFDYAFSRSFLQEDELPAAIYFDSLVQGKAVAALAIAASDMSQNDSVFDLFKMYFAAGPSSMINVYSDGPWCFWTEDVIFFFSDIKELLATWLAFEKKSKLSVEKKYLEQTLKKGDIQLLSAKAKQIASADKKPLSSITELIEESKK